MFYSDKRDIGESKGKTATGADSEAEDLDLGELSAQVQEEVWLPVAFLTLGIAISSSSPPSGKLVGHPPLLYSALPTSGLQPRTKRN